MTSLTPSNPHALDVTDGLLRDAYTDFVADLRGTLDLTAGVEEATGPRSYQALTDDLAHGLDLERGLTAITGASTPTRAGDRGPAAITGASTPTRAGDRGPAAITGASTRTRARSARARRRDRKRAEATMISELRWQWRSACTGTPLAQVIYTPSGATRAVPAIVHIDLGPPITCTVEMRPGQTLDDFIAAAPSIAPALGAATLEVTPLTAQWVRVVLLTVPRDVPVAGRIVRGDRRRGAQEA